MLPAVPYTRQVHWPATLLPWRQVCANCASLYEHPEVYRDITARANNLAEGMRQAVARTGAKVQINQVGSLLAPFFTPRNVESFSGAAKSDLTKYAAYFGGMLERGIYLAPAQFEAMFVSHAHSADDIETAVKSAEAVFKTLC